MSIPASRMYCPLCDAISWHDTRGCASHQRPRPLRPAERCPRNLKHPRLGRPRTSMLTNRQAEVAMLIAEGLDNHIIARRLGITVATAWKHTESIAFKLGVYRRDALVQRLRDIAAGKAGVGE